MQPIRDSAVREQIRVRNENEVRIREQRLLDNLESYKKTVRQECDKQISDIHVTTFQAVNHVNTELRDKTEEIDNKLGALKDDSKPKFHTGIFFIIAIVLFVAGCAAGGYGAGIVFAVVSMILYVIVYFICCSSVEDSNAFIEKQRASLEKKKVKLSKDAESKNRKFYENETSDSKEVTAEAERKIRQEEERCNKEIARIHDDGEKKTVQEIAAYDKKVNDYSDSLIKNPARIDDMVKCVLERIKELDVAVEYEPVVKFDLKFEVNKKDVVFYTDKDCDFKFNFKRKGSRDLTTDYECEGMAKALVFLSRAMIKRISPLMLILDEFADAKVTLHIKNINPNGRLL